MVVCVLRACVASFPHARPHASPCVYVSHLNECGTGHVPLQAVHRLRYAVHWRHQPKEGWSDAPGPPHLRGRCRGVSCITVHFRVFVFMLALRIVPCAPPPPCVSLAPGAPCLPWGKPALSKAAVFVLWRSFRLSLPCLCFLAPASRWLCRPGWHWIVSLVRGLCYDSCYFLLLFLQCFLHWCVMFQAMLL